MRRAPVCFEDFRALARRRLPRILFDYIEGGACTESTLRRNVSDFDAILLRQRVLRDVSKISLETSLFGERLAMPVALAPIGMAGMTARRGEVQGARAAHKANIPFCLSTMAICPVEEVVRDSGAPTWFQLYMIKDRGYMRDLLHRAEAVGCQVLVFTVDLPVPGIRYRTNLTARPSLGDRLRLGWDGVSHPSWTLDLYLRGRPHIFGNIAAAVGRAKGFDDFWSWIRDNGDAGITWDDLAWLRESWKGKIVIKGLLDPEDARTAVSIGADGIVVSNHGGRQLDGTTSSIAALPAIVDAVGPEMPVLLDGGVRSGGDVLKAVALGARACLIGRAWVYALGAAGESGVARMLELLRAEILAAMALTGCSDIEQADQRLIIGKEAGD
jgi:L-lactate dehydrogenase (cytochrome)